LGQPLVPEESGFSLLEILVAMTLTVLVLTGVFQILQGTMAARKQLQHHREVLQTWLHLRRSLMKDMHLLALPPSQAIVIGKGEMELKCLGEVAGGRLGPRVLVRYAWQFLRSHTGEEMTWSRTVSSGYDRQTTGITTFRVEERLEEVGLDLLDGRVWKRAGDTIEVQLRAIRWHFRWKNMGSWHFIQGWETG